MTSRSLLALSLSMLVSASPALAGRNAGGALIVHTDDQVSYTSNVCELFPEPEGCASANARTDKSEDEPALIWVVAAFPDGSDPGVQVVSFGNDHNLPDLSFFDRWGPCPEAGIIEIPDAGWPMGGGTAIGYPNAIVGDRLFAIYYFNVYGFAGAYIGTGVHPYWGEAVFVDDSDVPVEDAIERFGSARWYVPGANECPDEPSAVERSSWGEVKAKFAD
jgi:hypothetical protein